MSGSFPLFLPPLSERLRLCPIPPRFGSGAQSPDKSATFETVCGGAGTCARTKEENVTKVINAVAEANISFRISELLDRINCRLRPIGLAFGPLILLSVPCRRQTRSCRDFRPGRHSWRQKYRRSPALRL